MGTYTKLKLKHDHALQVANLFAGFVPTARTDQEAKELYRVHAKWLRKVDALAARLRGRLRKN